MLRPQRQLLHFPPIHPGRSWWMATICLILATSSFATADDFDRMGEIDLSSAALHQHARKHEKLGFLDIEALPIVLRDARSPLLVVVTDQGNIARLSVSSEFRKETDDPTKLIPTLVLNRFETQDSANRASHPAQGKNVWLFDGFGFDLDTGQVVPVHLGADLRFVATGPDDGELSPVGKADLYWIETVPPVPKNDADQPSEGRVIRPSDYAGKYRLTANGLWSGLLELRVDADGAASGMFRSDAGGASRPVTGKVAGGGDHRIEFTIDFPRTKQNYLGWLWNEGKNVVAGSATMLNQTFSFVAVREGSTPTLAPAGLAIVRPEPGEESVHTLTLVGKGELFLIDADPTTHQLTDLPGFLAEMLKADPDARIIVRRRARWASSRS